jgi:hippurate hydrolase
MPVLNRIADQLPEMAGWRHEIHRNPGLCYEEFHTSDLVAAKLAEWGIEVHRDIAGTGVVGVLRRGDGPRIGLRADMDALPCRRKPGWTTPPSCPARCMPAAMTGTPRCCSAPPST